MNVRQNIAIIGTALLYGCAPEPALHARGQEKAKTALPGDPVLSDSRDFHHPAQFSSLKEVDDAILGVRRRIAQREGEKVVENADFSCQGNDHAIRCSYEHATATMHAAVNRADALESCYHPNPDDTLKQTVELDCIFAALGNSYVSPHTRERLIACRTDILNCYENILQ